MSLGQDFVQFSEHQASLRTALPSALPWVDVGPAAAALPLQSLLVATYPGFYGALDLDGEKPFSLRPALAPLQALLRLSLIHI